MKDYLSIGKVSKLKNVSIKSLRYYDEIGIFKPAYVNQATNYRYYKEEQLYILDAISLCIELGIPLKTLPDYQFPDGSWDFHRLLNDGKSLAEEKIRSMRSSIDTLQSTLRRFDTGEAVMPKSQAIEDTLRQNTKNITIASNVPHVVPEEPKTADSIAAPDGSCVANESNAPKDDNFLPSDTYLLATSTKYILTTKFDVATSPDHYNHKLLALFVGAQKAGLNANYPAGLYYEWDGKDYTRHVFVQLESPDNTMPLPDDMEIKKLASGNCVWHKSDEHQIEHATDIFASKLHPAKPYVLLESNVTNQATKQSYFELRLYQSHLNA